MTSMTQRKAGDAEDRTYRLLVDCLVRSCRRGEGRIAPRRVVAGIWNKNATKTAISRMKKDLARGKLVSPEFLRMMQRQFEINELLSQMSPRQRESVARMLSDAFSEGVFTTLKELYKSRIVPFDKAYEGSPFDDFTGRLHGWPWPKARQRYD